MTSPNHIIELRKERERLDQWGASVEKVLAGKQHELTVIDKLKAANDQAMEELKRSAKKAGRRRVTLDDIKGCHTQREVLRFVAEAHFGLAHLGEVAELVVDARMSKADKDSVRATLYHYATDTDDFVHIGKSWVWLVYCGPTPTLEEVEAEEASDQQGDGRNGDGPSVRSEDGADSEPGGEPAPMPAEFGEQAA